MLFSRPKKRPKRERKVWNVCGDCHNSCILITDLLSPCECRVRTLNPMLLCVFFHSVFVRLDFHAVNGIAHTNFTISFSVFPFSFFSICLRWSSYALSLDLNGFADTETLMQKRFLIAHGYDCCGRRGSSLAFQLSVRSVIDLSAIRCTSSTSFDIFGPTALWSADSCLDSRTRCAHAIYLSAYRVDAHLRNQFYCWCHPNYDSRRCFVSNIGTLCASSCDQVLIERTNLAF